MLHIGILDSRIQHHVFVREVSSTHDAIDILLQQLHQVTAEVSFVIFGLSDGDTHGDVRACIYGMTDGLYRTKWEHTHAKCNLHPSGYVQYDYESVITWTCMICDFFFRLQQPFAMLKLR